jgi:hypothetical protein
VKSIRIKPIVLYASIIAAVVVIGLTQPTFSSTDNNSAGAFVYATEKPSASIPFCEDVRLPIHAFCENLDDQIPPRLDNLVDRSVQVAEGILARLDRL